jgi:DtxR family Mn-dependent transcriptional regulator
MIHVAEVPEEAELAPGLARLSELETGAEAVIRALSPGCVGPERLRLLDLGLVPGTRIRPEFESPFGSPRAYFIRGTMIALRREQAEMVLVQSEAA